MRIRNCFHVLLFIILAGACFADDSGTADYTQRLNASLNFSASSPEANDWVINVDEGGEFNISSLAKCLYKPCGTVELTLLYCKGVYCARFSMVGGDSYNMIYPKAGEVSYKCLDVTNKIERIKNKTTNETVSDEMLRAMGYAFECSNSVRIRAKTAGNYTLLYQAKSTNAPITFSEPFIVNVKGCGDKACEGTESYASCPVDCCTEECTAAYDHVCHGLCNGVNNCSIASDCDNKYPGSRSCLSPTKIISCCATGVQNCFDEQYCLSGYCLNCSRKCDGVCESSACYRTDPDCDSSGNASMACCGNYKIDVGEECEPNLGSNCLKECLGDCRCQAVTTTTRISTTTTVEETANQTQETPTTTWEETTTTIDKPIGVANRTDEKSAGSSIDLGFLLPALAVIVFIAGIVYLYLVFASFKGKQDYKALRFKQELLKQEKQTLMNKYGEGRVSEADASKLICELDEKISRLESKIEGALKKVR